MNFGQAYEALKQGAKIKRPHWRGFWCKENDTIVMHCKDGSAIPFLDTEDVFVDLDNVVASDWELVGDTEVKELNIQTFTFGEAISNLKRGKRVARKGWNGKGQYIELAQKISYTNSKNEVINPNHENIGNKAIAFVGTSGVQLGWLASQADMLADDWTVVFPLEREKESSERLNQTLNANFGEDSPCVNVKYQEEAQTLETMWKTLIVIVADHYGLETQMLKLAQECAELDCEVLHWDGDTEATDALKSEMADVLNMVESACYLYGCKAEVNIIAYEKMQRQIKRIERERCGAMPSGEGTTDEND